MGFAVAPAPGLYHRQIHSHFTNAQFENAPSAIVCKSKLWGKRSTETMCMQNNVHIVSEINRGSNT